MSEENAADMLSEPSNNALETQHVEILDEAAEKKPAYDIIFLRDEIRNNT